MGAHYIRFITNFFSSEYITVDISLRYNGIRGLYEVVKSGLTHEYFIKAYALATYTLSCFLHIS